MHARKDRMRCCIPSSSGKEPLLSTQELIERLEDTRDALDMRCRAIDYQCNEHKTKAKRFKVEDNRIECLSQLKMRHALLPRYELYAGMRDKISHTLNLIDQAQVVAGVAVQMGKVKPIIDGILATVNIDQIDAMLNDLEEQSDNVNEMSTILSQPIGSGDFDEDAALAILDDPAEELPNVPRDVICTDHLTYDI